MWLIYGATGYTGRLIAREAKRRGLSPILAGRSAERLAAMKAELGFETRAFGLEDPEDIHAGLAGVTVVLHCAGPFSTTHRPMFTACLRAKAHYLDITGEIRVFERVFAKKDQLLRAGIAAIPGVGFDVVPSDCLAAMLKRDLPDADRLALGFRVGNKVSPGTLKTMVEGFAVGSVVREKGALKLIPFASRERLVAFEGGPELAAAVPWGDVSTAYYSTGIPNIEVYVPMSRGRIRILRAANWLRPLLATGPAQAGLKKLVELFVSGESEAERLSSKGLLWGEAVNLAGTKVERRLRIPNGYDLTAEAAVKAVQAVLAGKVGPGPWTPSLAFGPDFVMSLTGASLS